MVGWLTNAEIFCGQGLLKNLLSPCGYSKLKQLVFFVVSYIKTYVQNSMQHASLTVVCVCVCP